MSDADTDDPLKTVYTEEDFLTDIRRIHELLDGVPLDSVRETAKIITSELLVGVRTANASTESAFKAQWTTARFIQAALRIATSDDPRDRRTQQVLSLATRYRSEMAGLLVADELSAYPGGRDSTVDPMSFDVLDNGDITITIDGVTVNVGPRAGFTR